MKWRVTANMLVAPAEPIETRKEIVVEAPSAVDAIIKAMLSWARGEFAQNIEILSVVRL